MYPIIFKAAQALLLSSLRIPGPRSSRGIAAENPLPCPASWPCPCPVGVRIRAATRPLPQPVPVRVRVPAATVRIQSVSVIASLPFSVHGRAQSAVESSPTPWPCCIRAASGHRSRQDCARSTQRATHIHSPSK